jgi:hypothetical protein
VSHCPELAALLDSRAANTREYGDVLGFGRGLGSVLGLGLEYAVAVALGLAVANGVVVGWD